MSLSIIEERKEVITNQGYVRPEEWLQLPYVDPTEQKFVGLFAVYDIYDNYVAFTCSGNYTVDWGDGIVENFISGVKAEHRYEYTGISSSTLCKRKYKQVIVTITPQVGQNLTSIDLNQLHSYVLSGSGNFLTPWLHLRISGPNLTSLNILSNLFSTRQNLIEQVDLLSIGSGFTSFYRLFYNSYSLFKVTMPNTSNVTNFRECFYACYSLIEVPYFDTSNAIDMYGMFNECRSLVNLPTLDTSNVQTMALCFRNCNRIKEITFSGGSTNLTDLNTCFALCYSLEKINGLDYENVLSLNNTFNSTKILNLKNLNTKNCSDFTNFIGPYTKTVENLITSAATSFSTILSSDLVFLDFDQISCDVILSDTILLSRDSIVRIFNNLSDRTSLPSRNINISNSFGRVYLTNDDRLIALNKNWTITG
jgi:surface protein